MRVYHTGFDIISSPDIRRGRANADFGQGFYLSDSEEFSRRWARERRGMTTYLNSYELDLAGLKVKYLPRGDEWFRYIFNNRRSAPDALSEYDVIVGAVAPDTIYDTWGILTSGLIDDKTALSALMLGCEYTQVVIKTEKAAAALAFLGASELKSEDIAVWRSAVREEEREYQSALSGLLESVADILK